jgi:accessory Sec system S-layer assembly protein
MGKVELLLMSENNKVLASKQFDLEVLDEIPARSDRPWVFAFDKQSQKVADLPTEGWKLSFNVQSLVPHQLDLAPTWEEALTVDQKEALKKTVEALPKLKDREVNFSGFQAKTQENGSLAVSLFIRNGHSQHITVDQLPLEVTDATGDLVARGSFTLDSLEIKANTSKAWTFIFPAEMIQKEHADFTRWTVRVPQQF